MSFLIPIISGLASQLLPPLIKSIGEIAQGKPVFETLGKEFLGIEPPAQKAVQKAKGVDIVTRTTPIKKPGIIGKIARGVLPFAKAIGPVILKQLKPKMKLVEKIRGRPRIGREREQVFRTEIRARPSLRRIVSPLAPAASLVAQRSVRRRPRRKKRKRKRKKKKKKKNLPAKRRFKRAI